MDYLISHPIPEPSPMQGFYIDALTGLPIPMEASSESSVSPMQQQPVQATVVSTCTDNSLETRYRAFADEINKGNNELLKEELKQIDSLLASPASSCQKRGLINQFLIENGR